MNRNESLRINKSNDWAIIYLHPNEKHMNRNESLRHMFHSKIVHKINILTLN
uniref:Uncharacterized protein n=1 Tax=Meloidogyne incognita TaxID=6306 RepID=A0A914LXP8_MELIC